jgi:hypothetical protein
MQLCSTYKKQHEGFAFDLVASGILEASTIFVSVAFLLAAVSLHTIGAVSESLNTSHAIVALYDRMFLLGQGFIPAMNDLLLGILLYKSRLVPRSLSIIGIAGGIPLVAGYLAVMFGVIERISPLAALSALPVAVFEFSPGIYLIVKVFRPSLFTSY